jgi:hypothetical protein
MDDQGAIGLHQPIKQLRQSSGVSLHHNVVGNVGFSGGAGDPDLVDRRYGLPGESGDYLIDMIRQSIRARRAVRRKHDKIPHHLPAACLTNKRDQFSRNGFSVCK